MRFIIGTLYSNRVCDCEYIYHNSTWFDNVQLGNNFEMGGLFKGS